MIKVLVEHDRSFLKQIKYVFDTMFAILGIRYEFIESNETPNIAHSDILLIYHTDPFNFCDINVPHILSIRSSIKLFGPRYLQENSLPQTTRRFDYKGKELISIYNDDNPLFVEVTTRDRQKITVTNLDFISDTFFMLTRYEEIVERNVHITDVHSRFPVEESLAFKNCFLDRPIVNEYLDFFWDIIDRFQLGYKRQSLWGDKDFAAFISHDIDYICSGFKDTILHAANLLKKDKNPKRAINNIAGYLQDDHIKNPAWTFEYITKTVKALGFTSSFYFMSGGTSIYENFYKIDDPKVIRLIKSLEDSDCEVGYHASFNSFDDLNQMNKEVRFLDNLVKKRPFGCRQHFLRFKAPETWRYQEKCGLLYDSTLAFADLEGFRAGICLPYKPFDVLENKVLNIWEIPLLIMDGTLKDYRRLTPEEALATSINLIKSVKKHHGVFSVLWHNTSFNVLWNGWDYVFEGIMNFLHRENCTGENGRTIIEIFLSRTPTEIR